MDGREKDLVWETLVAIGAIQKNSIRELNRLIRETVVGVQNESIRERLIRVRRWLEDIPDKEAALIHLLETGEVD